MEEKDEEPYGSGVRFVRRKGGCQFRGRRRGSLEEGLKELVVGGEKGRAGVAGEVVVEVDAERGRGDGLGREPR